MSETNTRNPETPEKDYSTDTLETVFNTTDEIVLEIKIACELAMRSIRAIGQNRRYKTQFFKQDRGVRYGQLENFDSQLKQETIKRKTLKKELDRKIDLLTEAIKLYKNAFLVRDLKRAKSMLEKSREEIIDPH